MIDTPTRLRRQTQMMRLLNIPMRRLLALPFATPLSRNLMLLHLTGRRTGRHYRQPVSYVRDGEVLLTPGGGRWTLNLQPGVAVAVRLAGRTVTARPDLLGDLDEVDDALTTIARLNPRATKFMPIARNADGRFDRDGLQVALDHGFRIVRWHLDPASA